MSNKNKYILAAVVLVTITLSIGIWKLFPTPAYGPPSSNSTVLYTNPDWTFPHESEPTTLLADFRPVIAEVMPSVVSITTKFVASDFFGRQYMEYTSGSGILIDGEGHIVTNNHVVEDAQSIYLELVDGRSFSADIVGTDPLSDLAVIKIDATDLLYANWGDSSSLSLGEWVLAIGNALGEGVIVTQGIVSRLNASVDVGGNTLYGLIQTTTAINPGNSGGPLVNMAGEVIGITSVKIVASEVEGMGFAISSNEAKPVIAARDLSVDEGTLIETIVAGSPAEAAGLRVGDVITFFNDQEISNTADLVQAIRTSRIGEEVEIVFVRGEDTRTTSARLIERPDF